MLAPLKNRSIIEQDSVARDEADCLAPAESPKNRVSRLEAENLALKAALRNARQLQRRNATEHIRTMVAQTNEINRLKLVVEQSQARIATLESGDAMIEMGRRLMQLSEANDRLIQAAQRVWHLDKTICEAHRECERLARERDCLADRLQRGAPCLATH